MRLKRRSSYQSTDVCETLYTVEQNMLYRILLDVRMCWTAEISLFVQITER